MYRDYMQQQYGSDIPVANPSQASTPYVDPFQMEAKKREDEEAQKMAQDSNSSGTSRGGLDSSSFTSPSRGGLNNALTAAGTAAAASA